MKIYSFYHDFKHVKSGIPVVTLAQYNDELHGQQALVISVTAALINLVIIMSFNLLYNRLAVILTDREFHRTQTEYNNRLILKIYLFQFVNYYSTLFYIAFFKGRNNTINSHKNRFWPGRLVGTPHQYWRVFGARQEECAPGGCFMELTVQLATIFVGKQFFSQVKTAFTAFFVICILAGSRIPPSVPVEENRAHWWP